MKRILFSLAAVAVIALATTAQAANALAYTNRAQMLANHSPLNANKTIYVGGTLTNGDGGAGWWTVVTNTLPTNAIRIASPLGATYAFARIPLKEDQSTNTYAASNDIDFLGPKFQLLTLTSNSVFTASNVAAGRETIVRLVVGNGDYGSEFTFPAWKFVGAAAPTGIAPNKVATLRLTAFGTAVTNVHALLSVEP